MDIEYESQPSFFGTKKINEEFDISCFFESEKAGVSQLNLEIPLFDDSDLNEFSGSKSFEENFSANNQDDSNKASKSHGKESLKFSRRLVKVLSKHLSNKSAFASSFLQCSAKVINSILAAFAVPQREISWLVEDQSTLLQFVWKELKDCLSYHKNKKICIVKPEYWNNVFCRKTFSSHIKASLQYIQDSGLRKLLAEEEGIFRCFCDILFSMNQLMTITYVLRDNTTDGGKFLRELGTIENLLLLVINSGLFEFYNHSSAKFAPECCGKCKICRSKIVPWNMSTILKDTREKLKVLLDLVPSVCTSDLEVAADQELFYLISFLISS